MLILVITQCYYREVSIQNQPPEVFCKKRCSLKFRKFHSKTCVGVSSLKFVKNIKKRLQYRCFPVKFAKLYTYFEEHVQTTTSVLNKVAGPRACNFIKKRLQHSCFPAKFVKFLRPLISKNIYERLCLFIDLFPKDCTFCETLLYCIRLG